MQVQVQVNKEAEVKMQELGSVQVSGASSGAECSAKGNVM